jgi:hypothetical protein
MPDECERAVRVTFTALSTPRASPTPARIAANGSFLVAPSARPLGVLLDLVASFLDALEAEFDLFPALENENGRGMSPPASVTI